MSFSPLNQPQPSSIFFSSIDDIHNINDNHAVTTANHTGNRNQNMQKNGYGRTSIISNNSTDTGSKLLQRRQRTRSKTKSKKRPQSANANLIGVRRQLQRRVSGKLLHYTTPTQLCFILPYPTLHDPHLLYPNFQKMTGVYAENPQMRTHTLVEELEGEGEGEQVLVAV